MRMEEIRDINRKLFKRYTKQLSQQPGVISKLTSDKGIETWSFASKHLGSLDVDLSLVNDDKVSFVSIGIKGADTSDWNTVENEHDDYNDTNLDYWIELAISSLAGDVTYNRSLIFRFEEVCFKYRDGWQCTRAGGDHSFGYLVGRKRLKKANH